MTFSMKLILFLSFILLTSCTTQHPRAIVYTSSWSNAYTTAILEQCMVESKMIGFHLIDYNYKTDTEGKMLEKFLLDSCVKYYNITI